MKSKQDYILPLLALFVVFLASVLKPSLAAPMAFASMVLLGIYFMFRS